MRCAFIICLLVLCVSTVDPPPGKYPANSGNASNPLLFVVGKTRVGKGECIKTLVNKHCDNVLDITSNALHSHTRQSTGYPFRLNGTDVTLVDTVGYDDSEGDDFSSQAFLKLLAETEKRLFYPPLLLLRELSGSDKEWLKRIRSVFPTIVCAVRCKKSAFGAAKASWTEAGLDSVPLFHLHEFQDEDDDGGISRGKYLRDLEIIMGHYSRLQPTREELDFDAEIFQGVYERVAVRTETKTEEHKNQETIIRQEDRVIKHQTVQRLENGGHYETRRVKRSTEERLVSALETLPSLGGLLNRKKDVQVWVKDYKDVPVDDSYVEKVDVPFIKTTTTRHRYERSIEEEWKVLAGGMRIFRGMIEGEWKGTGEEIIGEECVKA